MKFISTLTTKRKFVWITIFAWIFLMGILSAAPSVNNYTVNTGEDDLPADVQSVIAGEKVQAYFPDDGGQPALLVFKQDDHWQAESWEQIADISEWIGSESHLTTIDAVVPFHRLPDQAKESFRSEDGQTMVLPAILRQGIEMEEINETILAIEAYATEVLVDSELYITGPAGIASDTIAIFSNANLVLLFGTIGLVLILLIVIYRSPLLALIPLLAAGVVYQVVDRTLGFLAANQLMTIETQTVSIVMILLFGATTDYSLFIFSRFREELRKVENKYQAMPRALKGVAGPLSFCGGTVFAAMLVLLLANYGPYQNFAITFAITILIVLLAGLTLIPALFTVVGRRSFWPSIPAVGEETLKKNRFWGAIGSFVTKKPWLSGSLVLVFMIVNALNVPSIQYSFNLIDSFPEDMKSRVGFEILEESYHPGELAPTTVLIENTNGFRMDESERDSLEQLQMNLKQVSGVYHVEQPSLERVQEGSRHTDDSVYALQLALTLEGNPYDQTSLDTMDFLRDQNEILLTSSGLSPQDYNMYFAGETAKQADIRALNERDTLLVALVVTLVILVMLMWHTRSLIAPVYMMATILLSFLSALGISWWIFEHLLGMDGMSYRIPLYSFVFLVALGVDYNIMLISRIREENKHYDIRQAVYRGVAFTGGVISSAGIILAATFGVLMTQPIMELFMFGFIVSLGLIFDAFLVRGVLVPSIVTLIERWNWWPGKIRDTAKEKNVHS